MQFQPTESCGDRGLKIDAESREIVALHQAAFLLYVTHYLRCDVSTVERIAGSLESGASSGTPRGLSLLVGHELECAAQLRLHEDIPDFRRLATGQEHPGARRPALVGRAVVPDEVGEQRMCREPLRRKADGSGGHLAETHGAESGERCDPGIRGCGDDAALHAGGNLSAMPDDEMIRRDGRGPGADAVDRMYAAVTGGVDHLRSNTAEVYPVGLEHPDGDAGSDAGIDRVAARFEDLESGMCRKVVAGGDDMPGAHDGRTSGRG